MSKPCSCFKRRHLERKSVIRIPGVSSMKILVRDNLPTAIVNRFQSSSVIVPVRSRLESTFPELQIIRVANWSAPISSEKMPTV